MPKQYDSTLKTLVERYPVDWLKFSGVAPRGPVSLIDSDVSTLTAAADRVIYVDEVAPWLANIELQASYDPNLPERAHFYSTLLSRRHNLPVRSVIVLLRPQADGPAMSGKWSRIHPRTGEYLQFSYEVVRVWTQSADDLLTCGPGILPLAAITDDAETRLPDIISRASAIIETEFSTSIEGRELLVAEFVLLGLRHPATLIEQLLQGVARMEESTTYQAILSKGLTIGRAEGRMEGRMEGRAEALAAGILRIGRHRFQKEAPPLFVQRMSGITDIATLEALEDRILDATSWDELSLE